tara:strand:- start:147 stop:536 length:390 start_codon:yes stop_codon:yes gene_type:complete
MDETEEEGFGKDVEGKEENGEDAMIAATAAVLADDGESEARESPDEPAKAAESDACEADILEPQVVTVRFVEVPGPKDITEKRGALASNPEDPGMYLRFFAEAMFSSSSGCALLSALCGTTGGEFSPLP